MQNNDYIRIYKGKSMEGAFRFGDLLIFESVPLIGIKPGDVVIYRGLNKRGVRDELVHRVMSCRVNGLVVQGDNNPYADNVLVTEENLVGRVSHIQRNGGKIPINSRPFVMLHIRARHSWLNFRLRLWKVVCNMGRNAYGWLRAKNVITSIWRPAIKKVHLMTETGPLIKYVRRDRTVACYWPESGRFKCKKPYDLVIRRVQGKH